MAIYAWLDLGQVNVLCAYPGLLMLPVVTCVSMLVNEFEWGGRRYRFPDSGVVEVLNSGAD